MENLRLSRRAKEKAPLSEASLRWQAMQSLANTAARKKAPRFNLYAYRHSFAHRKLSEGTDSLVLATLMGHSDVKMLQRVYAHIHQNQDFLLAQLNKMKNARVSSRGKTG